MDIVRTLGVSIDASRAKAGGAQASAAFKDVNVAAVGMQQSTERATKQVADAGAGMGRTARAGDILRETLNRQNAVLSQLSTATERLVSLLSREKVAIDSVTTATSAVSAAMSKTTQDAKNLTSSTDLATQSLKRAAAASTSVGTSLKSTSEQARDAGGRFASLGTSAAEAARGTAVLSRGLTTLRGAAAAFGLALTGAGLVAFSADLLRTQTAVQRTANALRYASADAGDFSFNQSFLRSTSSSLGMERLSTSREFAKFMAAGKNTEFSGDQLREVFLSVAQASTVLGLSADETAGTFNALQQMISKGTVQAEELRGQLGERLPGAFGLAARAMSTTTQELGKMMERGEVTAYRLLPALAKELRNAFGSESQSAARSLQSEINRLTNSWTDFKDALFKSQVGDFFKGIIGAARGAVEAMTSLVSITGRLPFNAQAITPATQSAMKSWGRPPTYEPRLMDEFRYGGRAPKGEPWLLSQFSYGVGRSPLTPDLRALVDELRLMPQPPQQVGASIKSTMDRSLVGAFRYGMGDATRELRKFEEWEPKAEKWLRVREIGESTINSLSNGFGRFFDDFIADTGNAANAFRSMAATILREIASITARNLIAQPLAMGLGSMLGFGGTMSTASPVNLGAMHTGGTVGTTAGLSRLASPSLFAGAPRFHNGLLPDEFPAILQRGEEVVPKGQSGGRVSISMPITVNVDGSRGGSPESNAALGGEIARQIEGMVDERIARAMMPRGIIRQYA